MKPKLCCGHIGSLSFTLITVGGSTEATRPIPCTADATHLIDGDVLRCADHLGAALTGDGGRRHWEVERLDGLLGSDVDAALAAAGAPCALDRLQERHATTAERIHLIAGQRDQLLAALAWLDADHQRLTQVKAYIDVQYEGILVDARRSSSLRVISDPEAYAKMYTPTVGRAIVELADPATHHPVGS